MRSPFATRLACIVATAALTACSPTLTDGDVVPTPDGPDADGSSEPGFYSVPENRRTSTIIWSAEPGIDVFSNEATLTRAALEANAIALANPLADSYPGFARAIDQESKDQYEEFPRDTNQHIGTGRFHIMRIEQTDTGFVAHTCRQMANVAVEGIVGHYNRSVTTGEHNPRYVFERTPPDATPIQPPKPRATPPADPSGLPQWQAPTYDVFTGWNIDIDGSSGREHTHACRQWGHQYAPDAIENEYFILTTDTPPDTLPAYPGW